MAIEVVGQRAEGESRAAQLLGALVNAERNESRPDQRHERRGKQR